LLAIFLGALFGLTLIGYESAAANGNSRQTQKGDKAMSNNELVEALRRLDVNQESAVDALSRSFEEEARAPARAAVSMLNDRDPKMSERAAAIITNIGDLSIVPLLESPQPGQATDRVWNMDVVITAHLAVRGKIAARLKTMLSDKMKIPWGKVGPGEGTPAPSRVCDEAYLMMRRLLNASEDKAHFIHEREAFLALSDVEKDNEILTAKKSHTWTNLVESEE